MIKQNDCVVINYSAYDAESNRLFDTTEKKIAEKEGAIQEEKKYSPLSLIAGKGFIVKGLDESLIGKKAGDKYSINVPCEKGFGKWNPDLTENIRVNVFTEKQIHPERGMFVTIDGRMAKVAFVSNRMVKVDYNHPMSGKDLKYDIEIIKVLDSDEDKIKCMVENLLGDEFKPNIKEDSITIKGKVELPVQFKDLLEKELKEVLKKGYKVVFVKE